MPEEDYLGLGEHYKDTEEQMTMQGRLGRETRGQTFKAMHKATGTN